MAQRESRRSREIMKELRWNGWFCFKIHGTELVMKGLPDIIGCANGLFFALETKHPETRNKEDEHVRRQKYVHRLIRDAGGIAEVVVSPEEAVDVVRDALRAAGKLDES